MKLLVITFSTNSTNPGLVHLIHSLKKFGYDYHVLQGPEYTWDGNNYPHIVKWLKANRKDYTHILYTDAWDTLALDPFDIEAVLQANKIKTDALNNLWLSSAEKNCFPRSDWAPKFTGKGRWKYLNAGQYFVSIDYYIHIVESEPRLENENDQEWQSRVFLSKKYNMHLDTACTLFQTLYMEQPDEFAWTRAGRLVNLQTITQPAFVHGNGKCDMRWIYHPVETPFGGGGLKV